MESHGVARAKIAAGPPAAGALLFAGLIVLPFVASPYALYIAMNLYIAVVLALGLNLLMGYAGQISLANAAFYGIGAYAVAILGNGYGVSFWIALPLAGVLTACIGLIVGVPALRVSGHYLALATLGFVSVVQVILVNWVSMTGGSSGMATSRAGLGLKAFENDRRYCFVLLAISLLMIMLTVRIVGSRTGRAFMAIRDNENAAQIMGVNLTRYKTAAFGLSAFYCAVAGGMQAGLVRFLDPSEFGLWPSVWLLLYIVVGGLGSIVGSVIGPLILVALPETLRAFAEYRELIFTVILVLALIFMPDGVAGLLGRYWNRTVRLQQSVPDLPMQDLAARMISDPGRLSSRKRHVRPSMGETVLEVQDLSLSFGGLKVLQKVDLCLRGGEVRALIGPNGAGKTTFLNSLSRVYKPDHGTITFLGSALLKYKPHHLASLGIVRTFQNIRLFEKMTVLDNVLVGMHAHLRRGPLSTVRAFLGSGSGSHDAQVAALTLLTYVGLEHLAARRASGLSFGQQRRLELARALAADPVLLLLDEPASGLDKQEIDNLIQVLRTIRSRLGVTILLIEHNMSFVMELADHVSVLDHGTMIAEGTPRQVQVDPRVIEAYLGKENALVAA